VKIRADSWFLFFSCIPGFKATRMVVMKSMTRLALVAASSLPVFSVPVFSAASGADVSESNWGNVMFVGDSITHGVNSASWRWEMHKILVDNGVSYNGIGYKTGHHSGGVSNGEIYGGVSFSNAHSSQASARAWEIAGRATASQNPRFDKTNIRNWLGIDTTTQSGTNYTGKTFNTDTFFMLIGTNDLLSDDNAAGITEQKVRNLLGENLAGGDMKTIVDAMYQSNGNAKVTLFSIPAWTTHPNSNGSEVHQAVADYNVKLGTWVKNYNEANGKEITLVEVNTGIVDVASATPFFGVSSMFNKPGTASGSDGLHPNAQGDLIIAGNAAKALGYAGRTAGQERRAEAEFSAHYENFSSVPAGTGINLQNVKVIENALSFSEAGASSLTVGWDSGATLKNGFTVDFDLRLGNGDTDGWDSANCMNVTVGDAERYGVLKVSEAYIRWGDTVLYSADMSKNEESLRVSYVVGNAAEGLLSGFYVWLDDMLIGQGLSATAGTGKSGVSFAYSGSGNALLKSLSLDGSGAYAPDTKFYSDEKNAYRMSDPNFIPKAEPQGLISDPGACTFYKKGLTASGNYSAQDSAGSPGGKSSSAVIEISGGNATHIYANNGGYTGKLYVDVQGGNASAWYGAHTSGNYTGNVTLRLSGANTGGSTVFGAVNAGTVSGNVYLDLCAENAKFGSFTSTNPASVVGAYNAGVTGTLHIQIGAGTFEHDVFGGAHTASSGQSVGQTKIYVNGGIFKGDIYGGGIKGSIGSVAGKNRSAATPVSTVTVTGGTVSGGVYGGGNGDTINGDASVLITGGTISGGIYGGGTAGTINGNTAVTIDGNIARLRASSVAKWSDISGGGTSGTIAGNSTVTLKNIGAGNGMNGADRYAGTISGGENVAGTKTLVLDNVNVKNFAAELSGFDVVSIQNKTATMLTSLGGASTLNLAAGTSLKIASDADLKALRSITLGMQTTLEFDFSTLGRSEDVTFAVSEENTSFSVLAINGSSEMDLSRIKFKVGENFYDAEAKIPDMQAGTVFVGYSVPEPSAFGLLAGLGALVLVASRRRRK